MPDSQKLAGQKIVVTTIGFPHPTSGASTVLFYYYIKALLDSGAQVLHVVLGLSDKEDASALKAYVNAAAAEERLIVEVVSAKRPLVPQRFSVEQTLPDLVAQKEKVKGFVPNYGLAFDVPAGMVLNELNVPHKAIWLGDLQFDSNWYNYLYGFGEDVMTLRWLPYAIAQTRSWKKIYKRVLEKFETVVVSSASSVGKLADLGIHSEFHPYPWPAGELISQNALPSKPKFLFFGSLVGLGSRSALHFLFKKVYPQLVKKWGETGFEIIIGGREKPRGWMLEEMQKRPAIKFIGFIENLKTCMEDCHCVIAPLDVPVGNRSRILTAWSMGALVVAHENAALGNSSLIDGQTALLAHTAEEFAQKMIFSVEKPDKSKLIVDLARDRYLKEYSLEKASPLFVDIFSNAISR